MRDVLPYYNADTVGFLVNGSGLLKAISACGRWLPVTSKVCGVGLPAAATFAMSKQIGCALSFITQGDFLLSGYTLFRLSATSAQSVFRAPA